MPYPVTTSCHSLSFLIFSLEQTDLVLEAAHLDAFNANFAAKAWDDCRFPRVLFRAEDVLVRKRGPRVLALLAPWFSFILRAFLVSRTFVR